jgi:maltooligosyltrehalose trehalohydrolase
VTHPSQLPLGACWQGGERTSFTVWAPRARQVELLLGPSVPAPDGRPTDDPHTDVPVSEPDTLVAMQRLAGGYHHVTTAAPPGTTYRYRLHRDGHPPVDRADPASRWQPAGVSGPSAVDEGPGEGAPGDGDATGFVAPPMHRQVIYELHVGTFSPEGTFDGVVDHLDELVDLGVTTLELLPVAQFPGERNWGYDGVGLYAVQHSYGGPAGLRRLVDAAHARGLAVWLDVVYNHLGPEGNHLDDFGPYFTDHYATPWGPALNADGADSDAVRRFVVDNAARWVEEFGIDGLRLDAVHAIIDQSATHLLEEIGEAVHAAGAAAGRRVHVVAESDLCDARLMRHPEAGGYGLDGQWADDFHHAVHVALTGERDGYYADYRGLADLVDQLRDRYVYAGRYSPNRGRTVGRAAPDVPYDRFVVCVQNHDQVGNRKHGDRLGDLIDFEGRKLAAAAVLTSPFVPMLFMGEEYAEPAPFQFFTSFGDPNLGEAVREGRRAEFAAFESWRGEAPDPQDPETFARSRLDRSLRGSGDHARLHDLYRALLELRRTEPLITDPRAPDVEAATVPGHEAVILRRRSRDRRRELMVVLNADESDAGVVIPDASGVWERILDTADERWGGPGGPPEAPDSSPGTGVIVPDATGVLTTTVRRHSALVLLREES